MTEWNSEQQEVIDSLCLNKNILVSAAAGSGKTAVLVERIIRSIKEGLAAADEILVVTFTRAAAAQMKTKIGRALEKEAILNTALAGQLALMDRADIMTIDSFCNRIVRENFSAAGIDPSFSIIDSEEASLLKEDILEDCLATRYDEDPEFRRIAGFFLSKNINDDELKKVILRIFRVSESFADPDKFFCKCRAEAVKDAEDVDSFDWIRKVLSDIRLSAESVADGFRRLEETIPDTVEGAEEAAFLHELCTDDILHAEKISNAEGYDEIAAAADATWMRFGKKAKCVQSFGEEYMNSFSKERDRLKKAVAKVPDKDELKSELGEGREIILKLIEVTEDFAKRLLEEKFSSNAYEFSDISHFAYKILHDENTDTLSRTALQLRENYKYIYIDEYQDSNDLQEEILGAIARRDEKGRPNNVFMVGDVKQSIYRFRLARPKLFMDKQELYSTDSESGRLIALNKNYRSRREVLYATNFIFERLMRKETGEIDYDEAARLNYPFETGSETSYPYKTELHIIRNKDDDEDMEDGGETPQQDEQSYEALLSGDETEALLIADIIDKTVNGRPAEGISPLYIENEGFDPKKPESSENPKKRKAEYRDVVILQRGISGSSPMLDIYEEHGIPVMLDDKHGYFDASEVVTMLSILRVIDNPRQDIPLASVLLSPVGGLNEPELTIISNRLGRYLYDRCEAFAAGFIDSENASYRLIAEKLKGFLQLLTGWREKRAYISIAELIDTILLDTGYDIYVSLMPEGSRRLGNLRMLRYRAETRARGSLFEFLRYIDKCRIHDIDFGEAADYSDAGNVVHVTSIHSSKGLEYPVVIVARMGHRFNLSDTSGKVLVSTDYGLAVEKLKEYANGIYVREKGIKKNLLADIYKRESLAEEMRLLYVAMTRAKEKLILIGRTSQKPEDTKDYSYLGVMSSDSLLDFVLPVVECDGVEKFFDIYSYSGKSLAADWIKKREARGGSLEADYARLCSLIDERRQEPRENPYDYKYSYNGSVNYRSKLSVTGIEKIYNEILRKDKNIKEGTNESEAGSEMIAGEARKSSATANEATAGRERKASADGTQGGNTAARQGTVVHKIMELLDYKVINTGEDMKKEVDRIINSSFFTDEDRAHLRREEIIKFYSDDEGSLFRRMKKADEKGLLFREKSFLMGMKPAALPDGKIEGLSDDDMVTVQGIMDAFFFEEDEAGKRSITLVDYKTDRIRRGEELIERYSVQLYLYFISLSRITDAEINDIIFYSFALGREIECKLESDYFSDLEMR